MKQEQIDYSDIMDFGFNEEIHDDKVYFNQHGYEYAIVTKKINNLTYLDWVKETRLCEVIKINNEQDYNIIARLPIQNLEHLKTIIDFFL